jgi:hypothetical protein
MTDRWSGPRRAASGWSGPGRVGLVRASVVFPRERYPAEAYLCLGGIPLVGETTPVGGDPAASRRLRSKSAPSCQGGLHRESGMHRESGLRWGSGLHREGGAHHGGGLHRKGGLHRRTGCTERMACIVGAGTAGAAG